MIGQFANTVLEYRRDFAHVTDDAGTLVDFDRLERYRTSDRMRGIGVTVAEGADFAALIEHRLVEILLDGDGTHRKIGGGDRLRHRDRMDRHAHRLGAEPVAGTAEAADHLIADEAYVIFGEHLVDLDEIGPRRDDDAARPHDRLG